MNNRKWMNKRTEPDCRKPLEVILGQPGCGKTFYMKKEIKQILSTHPEDKVIVFGERWDYEDLGFSVLTEVKNANPLFVTKDTLMNLDLDEIVYQKTPIVTSIFEATGHNSNSFEVRAIWHSLKELYKKWRAEYDTMECPTLLDVYEILLRYKAPEYPKVAMCLEPIAVKRQSILNNCSKEPAVSKEELQKLQNNGLLIDIYNMIRNVEKTVSRMQNCNYLLKLYIDQIREQIEPETRIWVFIDELHPFLGLETANCSIDHFVMANDDFITDLYLGVKHDFYNKAGCFYNNTIFTVATQEIAEAAPAGLIQKAGFVTLFSTRIDQMDIVKKQTGLPDNISGILINQGPGMGLWYDKERFYPFNINEF